MKTKDEKDRLQIVNERIDAEVRYGDKAEACRKAKVSVTTLDRGLSREKYDDVTDDEHKGIVELMKILNERKNKQTERAKEIGNYVS